jgi:biotin-(acetyl-CoA carboxylase) ligase
LASRLASPSLKRWTRDRRWRATLKWPNDVFIDGAKASGIMLDSGAVAAGGHLGRSPSV